MVEYTYKEVKMSRFILSIENEWLFQDVIVSFIT